MSFESCKEWNKNKTINPITGRRIKAGSALYKKIEKQCMAIKGEKIVNIQGEYFIPNKQGMVPCKLELNIYYVLRKIIDNNVERYVYGPLNKYFRSTTKWVYFKDTWDYHNGFYKPIFMDKNEPVKKFQNSQPMGRQGRTQLGTSGTGIVDQIVNYFIPEK